MRVFILGAGTYPHAQAASTKVPRLPNIASASKSALDLATRLISEWSEALTKPLQSVDLLVNSPAAPDGETFLQPGGAAVILDPPTLANIKAARKAWLDGAGAEDMLLFYCCGHGIWLASGSRTYLASDFAVDPDEPWSNSIALDDFALALGDEAPRLQWLMFDCCSNMPPAAMTALGARGNPLLQLQAGRRGQQERAHGRLAQVNFKSASLGAQAFGKPGRASRFMEVLLDAFSGSGYQKMGEDGKWWLDNQGLKAAFDSYAKRIAPIEDEDYFTFVIENGTDAAGTPRLMSRADNPTCLLFVSSDPSERLLRGNLSVKAGQPPVVIGGQQMGANATTRYRMQINPWVWHDVDLDLPEGQQNRKLLAQPPLAEAKF